MPCRGGGGARELFIHSGICCPGEGGNSMNFLAKMGTSERSVALVTFLICITFSSIYAVPRGGGARELFIHSGICCPGEGGNSVNFLAKMGTSERSVALVTFLICITFSSIYAVPRGGRRARAFHTFWHLLPWGGWQLREFSRQNGHVWKICSTCHIFDLHNFFEYICRAEGGRRARAFHTFWHLLPWGGWQLHEFSRQNGHVWKICSTCHIFDLHNFFEYICRAEGGRRARAFHTFWHLLPWGGWQFHEFSRQNGHVWKICSTCHIFDLHNFFEYICRAEGGRRARAFHTFWHLLPWGGWQLHEFSRQNGHVWKICSTCHIFDLHNFFEYICRAEGGRRARAFHTFWHLLPWGGWQLHEFSRQNGHVWKICSTCHILICITFSSIRYYKLYLEMI
uniref:49c38d6e-7674-4a16-bde5-7f3b61c2cfd4-CDS n=1 Tax=Plasmodiophora brassicae TaxID=37360 RepID=A0A3P3YW76_PLABS|nr:49c38d6e-7674-4a16-bde5-7f3b61c2cfd4-CDS [Plasmodiophora brassicae]